ncbi:RNA polymerase sigma factor [Microbulbifer sp. HZ11]|uniref:RNA polymerase sigma factor n=1 Tax=unclassified Microbulbifer TaxID=2619833 RepID=UPI000691DC12|nr:RNA polymerase sigma factor [Microbulbifer sp. HZ11]
MKFEQKVCEHIPGLTRYALALCAEKSQAEDLVQDCMERALRKRHLWRPASTLKPWLFRMLYRIYLNQRSSARARKESLVENAGEDVAISSGHEAALDCRDAMSAIQRLPEEQRSALLLIVLENPSYREAADILGVNAGTLRSRVSRARESVRKACAENVPDTGGSLTCERTTANGTILQRVK